MPFEMFADDRYSCNSVIAKSITDGNSIHAPTGISRHRGDLLDAVSLGRQVELVGLLRQLRDAGESVRSHRGNLYLRRKRSVEIFQSCALVPRCFSITSLQIVAVRSRSSFEKFSRSKTAAS